MLVLHVVMKGKEGGGGGETCLGSKLTRNLKNQANQFLIFRYLDEIIST